MKKACPEYTCYDRLMIHVLVIKSADALITVIKLLPVFSQYLVFDIYVLPPCSILILRYIYRATYLLPTFWRDTTFVCIILYLYMLLHSTYIKIYNNADILEPSTKPQDNGDDEGVHARDDIFYIAVTPLA